MLIAYRTLIRVRAGERSRWAQPPPIEINIEQRGIEAFARAVASTHFVGPLEKGTGDA